MHLNLCVHFLNFTFNLKHNKIHLFVFVFFFLNSSLLLFIIITSFRNSFNSECGTFLFYNLKREIKITIKLMHKSKKNTPRFFFLLPPSVRHFRLCIHGLQLLSCIFGSKCSLDRISFAIQSS